MLDVRRLAELAAFVNGNADYAHLRDIIGSLGNISMITFDDLDRYVHTVVQQGFAIRTVPERGGDANDLPDA